MPYSNTFDATTKEDWLKKIHAELKGRKPSDLDWIVDTSLKIPPFVHLEDSRGGIVSDISHSFDHQIPICKIPRGDVHEMKRHIDQSLDWGCGSLYFEEEPSHAFRDVLWDGISMEVVKVVFSSGGPKLSLQNYPKFKSDFVQVMRRYLLESRTEKITIEMVLGTSFYLNLCIPRSISIILDQLCKDLQRSIDMTIISWYPYDDQHDIATHLLRSMPAFLAALMGGSDHLGIWGDMSASEQRLMLNNVQLLLLESHIPLDRDTVSGSFYLDEMTEKIARDLWADLYENMENEQ